MANRVFDITSWHPERIISNVVQGHAEAAARTTGKAKLLAPHKTSQLRRSIRYSPVSLLSGYIESVLPYAAIQEEGGTPGWGGHIEGKAYLSNAVKEYPALLVAAVRRRFLGL